MPGCRQFEAASGDTRREERGREIAISRRPDGHGCDCDYFVEISAALLIFFPHYSLDDLDNDCAHGLRSMGGGEVMPA
jgi:hypothetical protein